VIEGSSAVRAINRQLTWETARQTDQKTLKWPDNRALESIPEIQRVPDQSGPLPHGNSAKPRTIMVKACRNWDRALDRHPADELETDG